MKPRDPEMGSASSTVWPSYTDVLAPYAQNLAGLPSSLEDPQLRQEFYRWLFSQAAQGYFGLIYQDPEYPDFWPVYNQAFNFGFPNPDDSYYMTPINGDGVYRISGFRGTVRILDFQVGTNLMMVYGQGPTTKAEELSPPAGEFDIDRDGVHLGRDGAFDVVLSAERPAGYRGDWWKLDPRATFILVRQRAYDWLNEVDGRLAIERVDRPAVKPRPSGAQLAQKLSQMSPWMENWTKLMLHFGISLREAGLINRVAVVEQRAGITAQRYVMGTFDLRPNEALVLETELPAERHYWMFHLTDEMMSAIDPLNRQTSLNGHTATVDADGKFRAVISAEDPGVPNWLDTAAYVRGGIIGRWMNCSSAPLPGLTRVKATDVRKYLPADTPIVSAEQRDSAIRLRRKGAQLRRRW
jgi:hypothetical protein